MTLALVLSLLALQQPSTIRPQLSRTLEDAPAAEMVPAYAVLADRPDYVQLGRELASLGHGERGPALSQRLKAHDAAARGAILSELATFEKAGKATRIFDLHVANAVAFRATPDAVLRIAGMEGVAYVELDADAPEGSTLDTTPSLCPPPVEPARSPSLGGPTVPPNLTKIGAPSCWALGYDGRGVVVAIIDTGTAYDNPSLSSHIWKNPGEIPGNGVDDDGNGFIDDVVGWDFGTNDNDPWDPGHGTQVAGIIAGDGTLNDGVQQIVTGVAPRATLMVLKLGTGQSSFWASQQYAIDKGAWAVSSSNSWKWPSVPDYFMWRALTDAELAAGIIHSNSIGNQGNFLSSYPIPFNIAAPGNSPGPWPHPSQVQAGLSSVIGVAGVLANDALYTDSGVGPAAWENITPYSPSYPYPQNAAQFDYPYAFGAQPGLLKPDISAPTDVPSLFGATSYYSVFGGTSGAQPHIGGALAVLLEANPKLEPRHIGHVMQATALDLGPPGKDIRFGAGRIQLYEALQRAIISVTCTPQAAQLGDTVVFSARAMVGKPTVLLLALDDSGSVNPITGPLDVSFPFAIIAEGIPPVKDLDLFSLPIPGIPALQGFRFFTQLVVDDTTGTFGKWLVSPIEWFDIV